MGFSRRAPGQFDEAGWNQRSHNVSWGWGGGACGTGYTSGAWRYMVSSVRSQWRGRERGQGYVFGLGGGGRRREGKEGWQDGWRGEGEGGDSGSVGGEGRNITCERNRSRRGKELKWKWQWNEGKEGNKKKKKKQNNNNVTKKRLLVWQGTTEIKHFYYIHKADKYKHNTRGLHMQVYTQLSNVGGVGAGHTQRHTFHFHRRSSCQSFVV